MTTVCYVMGSASLVEAYQKEIDKILNAKMSASSSSSSSSSPVGRKLREIRALELMQGFVSEFQPKLDQDKIDLRGFDVKKELYRLPQTVISSLALYHGLKAKSSFGQIDELYARKVISKLVAARLKKSLAIIFTLRVQTHLFYKKEMEILYHAREKATQEEQRLFIITPQLNQTIVEIYRTLIPFHQAALRFLGGALDAFRQFDLYDQTVGQYNDQERANLQFDNALGLAEQAVALDPNNPSYRLILGIVKMDLQEVKESIRHFQEALILAKKEDNDQSHLRVANILNNLAIAYGNLSKFQKSLQYYLSAMEIYQKIYNDQLRIEIAGILLGLSTTYRDLNDLSKAFEYLESSRKMFKSLHKNHSHSAIANTLNNLGNAYGSLGNIEKATKYYLSSLAMFKQLHNHQPHRVLSIVLNNLGNAYSRSENFIEAAQCYEESLANYKVFYPEQLIPEIIDLIENLINIYIELKNVQKADEYRAIVEDIKTERKDRQRKARNFLVCSAVVMSDAAYTDYYELCFAKTSLPSP